MDMELQELRNNAMGPQVVIRLFLISQTLLWPARHVMLGEYFL